MRKWISGAVITLSCLAVNVLHGMYHYPEGWFDISAGWRKDNYHWNKKLNDKLEICRDGLCNKNKNDKDDFMVMRWRDVYIAQVLAQAKYVNCYNFYFRGYADYGRIYHGRHRRTIYEPKQDHRKKCAIFRSHSTANRGEVYDLSGGIGYLFRFLCERATITPILGYSYHMQHYRMGKSEVTVVSPNESKSPFKDSLKSHFHSRFKGWWGGVDTTLYMTCDWWLEVSGEFHWGHYYGKGKIDGSFPRPGEFKQHSDCLGQVWTVGTNWEFCKNWYLTFFGRYQMWVQVDHGVNKRFFDNHRHIDNHHDIEKHHHDDDDDEGFSRRRRSRLKAVKWHSIDYSAGVGYYF